MALFIPKLCLWPLPGSQTLLGRLSSPVLCPTRLSPSTGGTFGALGAPGTPRSGMFVTLWAAGGAGFVLQPFHCLKFPFHAVAGANICSAGSSCSCMHFRQLFPSPANTRDVTAGPVLSLFPPQFQQIGIYTDRQNFGSSAAPGAETKQHHPALLQPPDAENKITKWPRWEFLCL